MSRVAGQRTQGDSPTAEAYRKYGDAEGKFPIFDRRSAMSAISLRGHSGNPQGVLARAQRWASEHKDKVVRNAVGKASE